MADLRALLRLLLALAHNQDKPMTEPVPGPDYRGVRLKLKRARTHVNSLGRELRNLPTSYSPLTAPDRNGWWVSHYQGKPPPLRFGVIAGDFAHNARSALDHLVHQLVIANGVKPGKHNVFPIYTRHNDWIADLERRDPKRGPSPLEGVSTAAWEAIRDIQPFATTARYKDAVQTAPWQLHRLSLIDKHRHVHVAHARVGDAIPTVEGSGLVVRSEYRWFIKPDQELAPGQKLIRIRFYVPSGLADMPIMMNLKLPVTITFDLGREEGGMIRVRRMREILAEVTDMIENLISAVG